jgi:hypothetical protein
LRLEPDPLTTALGIGVDTAGRIATFVGGLARSRRLLSQSREMIGAWDPGRSRPPRGPGDGSTVEREDELAMTERHVREGERSVVRQEKLIAKLRREGLSTAVAEEFLDKLRMTLAVFCDHLLILRRDRAAGGGV